MMRAWCFYFYVWATLLSLSQACLTFSSLSQFAFTYSDWIQVVHIHLVYLCLLKEPIFHKTSPDTPSYIWFLSALRFSWSFITNWLVLHLLVMMSYHLYLEDEYRITHPLIHSTKMLISTIKIYHEDFLGIETEDIVGNKASSSPEYYNMMD